MWWADRLERGDKPAHSLMLGFYLTCVVFVFGVLGVLLRVVSGVSIFKLVRYLARVPADLH